jgi:hypothetical protein
MIHCHYIFYYSPQAAVSVVKLEMRGGVDSGEGDVAQPRPIHRPGNGLSRDPKHSQGKMSYGSNELKIRLFYDPSVARLWCNTSHRYVQI